MLKENFDLDFLKDKFVIFSYGRCGTTNICDCLNVGGVKCLAEPLKPDYKSGPYCKLSPLVETPRGISTRLMECGHFDGIKHLACQCLRYNKKFLTKFKKIIHITRRDKLNAAVSMVVAQKTRHWHKTPESYPEINVNFVKNQIKIFDAGESIINDLRGTTDILDVFYEDFFFPDVDVRMNHLKSLFDFLERDFKPHNRMYKVLSISNKVNPKNLIQVLPNSKELENEFIKLIKTTTFL